MKGLEEESSKFYEPIKMNQKVRQAPVTTGSSKQKLLKQDCQLFSKLFVLCQSRECDLKDFFRHENHPFPAALSDGSNLYSCQKSQLGVVLESLVTIPDTEREADVIIVDGSALVTSLQPRSSKFFEEHAVDEVLPRIEVHSTKYKRTDIVFDVYQSSSLKAETRSNQAWM